ncbi:hypothetical protein ANO11243_086980 [Dothideomycetidae sp. 11243]|nr:hypothetical protein ANO11243_086980 [fungal sp. No.11243]
MPGVLVDSMSSPTANAADDVNPSESRRSRRVSKRPHYLVDEQPSTSKRKRDAPDDGPDDEDVASEESNDGETDAEDDEPDEEELRDRRTKKARNAPKRPATKKAKTNGTALQMPIRNSALKAKRPRKRAAGGAVPDADQAGGLYAEIFSGDKEIEEVVSDWIQRFKQHESSALADVINFVLKCCGCDSEVTHYDVEDVDGATNRIGDLQEEFQAQNVSDYPIIARTKFAATLKHTLMEFFSVLVKTIDATDVLFTNVELIENVQVWLSTMSGAQNRPFRHTATVASLSVTTALCEIGRDLATAAATAKRQSESMKKGRGANKKRASGLDEDAQQAQQKQTLVDTMVKDWFDTIFIHRYRDVDPKIRVDCAEALGEWIVTYPDVFFDAQHLRYLGWVLSDAHPQARHEVLKQLLRLYEKRDRLAGLKVFTERFRERIVEMATLDNETGVRSLAIQLLNHLRDAGYLEPDDIDTVGRLVFDAEQRVRKAVVPFFLASVNDMYEAKVEDLGGLEAITEETGDDADSSERPGLPWLKVKCLAEILEAYDAFDPELSRNAAKGPGGNYRLHAEELESRFITVGGTLYHDTETMHDWDSLAKYLLYDTSESAQNGVDNGIAAQLKGLCKLSAREEYILLELLNVSIRQHVSELVDAAAEKRGKKTKRQRDDLADDQESSARQITNLIPQLLKRFGDSPETALAVLRLERIVSLEAFSDFQQDASTYKNLLGDIEKQFLSHGNEDVMTEASRALLRAKQYQDLGDVTEEKIEELWEETIETFRRLCTIKEPSKRGNLTPKVLDALTKTVYRIERLSSISDPGAHLRAVPDAQSGRKGRGAPARVSALELLTAFVRRAVLDEGTHEDRAAAEAEDVLSIHAAQTLGLYLLWSTSSFAKLSSGAVTTDDQIELFTASRDNLLAEIAAVLESRSPSSSIAAEMSQIMLDVHTSNATLRNTKAPSELSLDMPPTSQALLLRVLTACERRLANKTGKHIEKPRETRDEEMDDAALAASPVASDDEDAAAEPQDGDQSSAPPSLVSDSDSSSASSSDGEQDASQLLAEKRLCTLGGKLVLAALAGAAADERGLRKRLELNRAKLGPNWREVVKFLDADKPAAAGAARKKAPARPSAPAPAAARVEKSPAVVVVESESENEDEDMLEEEEDEDEDEGREEVPEAEVESVLGD